MPCIVLAGILIVDIVCAVVDSEVESVGVGARRAWLRVVVRVDAACGVILSVPVVGVAGCDVECSIFMIAYCQMKGVCAGTVVGIDIVICVCACLGIGAVVPCKGFACILIVCIVCAVVDCKV